MITVVELAEVLTRWQQKLGLTSWDIRLLVADPDDPSSTAECHRSDAFDRATIVIAPWVLTGEPPDGLTKRPFTRREAELAVVHELLHCHTRDLVYCTELVKGDLAPGAARMLDEAAERAEEQLVDRLARALLPPD